MSETEASLARLRRQRRYFLLVLLLLLGIASALQWSPARHWLNLTQLAGLLQGLGHTVGPPGAVLGIALGCMLAVPLSLLTVVSCLAFGALSGSLYALLGASLGAAGSFLLGRWLGQDAIARLAGEKVQRVSRRLGERGILSVIAIRLVPAAPFAVVNMVVGVSPIRLRDFLLGNAIGMLPLLLMSALFSAQLLQAASRPGWLTALIAALVLGAVVLVGVLLKHWLLAPDNTQDP